MSNKLDLSNVNRFELESEAAELFDSGAGIAELVQRVLDDTALDAESRRILSKRVGVELDAAESAELVQAELVELFGVE